MQNSPFRFTIQKFLHYVPVEKDFADMLVKRVKKSFQTPVDYAAYLFGARKSRPRHPQLWILMYHRILPKTDPRYAFEEPGMIVEPQTFKMHLDIVRQHFTLIPLHEWVKRRRAGQPLPPKSCAITFDDGWRDNYEYAFPILKEKGVPATVFAVSHMIGTRQLFWPNRVALLLQKPAELLSTLPWLAPHWKSLNQQMINREIIAAIIKILKAYPDDQINQWLEEAGLDHSADDEPMPALMDWGQLKAMSTSNLIDVGSHTCHHYRLQDGLDPIIIQREVEESKKKLEAALEEKISLFCYPNGDVCHSALQLVSHHYEAAVTTRRGINSGTKFNHYELLRIGLHEDRCNTPTKFYSRLTNWY
jgi:peptidoglycan/xylan/chitin deacetylase (PgdA/CDA1 family)